MHFAEQRERMVARQIENRGVRDEHVLRAMREVPREEFIPEQVREFAYRDTPVPVGEGQTISQPYIVAVMIEALGIRPGERVLDVGTGSGYAAAVMSRIADEVYTVERHASLVRWAKDRFQALGYDNIHVRHGDGSLGWSAHAPYDAIMVAASGPDVPRPLKDQMAVGGRLIVPAGPGVMMQRLMLIERLDEHRYRETDLGAVQFVPLIGRAGWRSEAGDGHANEDPAETPAGVIRRAVEPFDDVESADLGGLLDRIGDARVVCMGEATHGTSEFCRMRARITRELIEKRGFSIVAAEADWADAAGVDRYVRHGEPLAGAMKPFRRFPAWMWGNTDVVEFVDWLRRYNERFEDPEAMAGFYGIDLYSLFSSIESVLKYLEEVDPESARIALHRYGCLTPYETDPSTYGAAALSGRYRDCEEEVVRMLQDLQQKRMRYIRRDGQRFFDALQNARLVASAEQYYRSMYYGGAEAWNLRDRHMFDTLRTVLDFREPDSRAVVWAHNSHLGDARATEMSAQGQLNAGQLCREHFGEQAYLIGFGTHSGTVAAASNWGQRVQVMDVRPTQPESYEHLFHETGIERFLLPLRHSSEEVHELLSEERPQRAIGVVYRPATERQSHYFRADLARQFDEYIWFDESRAVTPVSEDVAEGMPETFPFGV